MSAPKAVWQATAVVCAGLMLASWVQVAQLRYLVDGRRCQVDQATEDAQPDPVPADSYNGGGNGR